MFVWKVADMALLKEKGKIFFGDQRVYGPESTTTREDKIAFVDGLNDGRLSYLLNLIAKFKQDSQTMPKDEFGNVTPQAFNQWITKNDTRGLLFNTPHPRGKYVLMNSYRYIQSDRKGDYDLYDDLVDEAFHRQLQRCEDQERHYFADHDEYSILAKQFVEYQNRYGTSFGVPVINCGAGKLTVRNSENKWERELTLEELKELIGKYQQVEALITKLTAETTIVY